MSITKSEAIFLLAIEIGNSDGDFSDFEMTSMIKKNPYFASIIEDCISTDVTSKMKSGELNQRSAIATLKQLSKNDQIEAIAICFGIVMADGVMTDKEKDILLNFSLEIGDIDFEIVLEKYKEMISLSTSQKTSSGIFIPNGDRFSELTDNIENKTIIGIANHLDYHIDQVVTYDGDYDENYDVRTVIIEIFSCKIIFVITKNTVTKLDKKKVDYFLRNFKFEEEFDSVKTKDILQSGIENKSLRFEFLSKVLSLNEIKQSGIFYAKSIDLNLSFKEGFLISFQSPDGLNEWARNWKQMNANFVLNMENYARKYWGDNNEQIIKEINLQSEAIAYLPNGLKNEFIPIHKTDFGTVNYIMLLVCHYKKEINLPQFMELNHGRYETLLETNNIKKFGLNRFIYEFSNDNKLITSYLKN